MQEDKLLDVQHVAARLGVNPRTVLRMVERGELPAIKVAHRLRFRHADLERYLQTHLSTSPLETTEPAISNGKQPEQDHWQDTQDDESGLPVEQDAAAEARPREQARALVAQGSRRSKELAQLELEKQRLELERQRLALEKEDLELHTKRINYALEAADKMVKMLLPDVDGKTKAMLYQSLLQSLLQPGPGKSLESVLSGLKIDTDDRAKTSNGRK